MLYDAACDNMQYNLIKTLRLPDISEAACLQTQIHCTSHSWENVFHEVDFNGSDFNI